MDRCRTIEIEVEGIELAFSTGPIDYWLQDDVKQWWLAALVSESMGDYKLRSYLKEHGILNTTSPINDTVSKLRNLIVEEFLQSWLN